MWVARCTFEAPGVTCGSRRPRMLNRFIASLTVALV